MSITEAILATVKQQSGIKGVNLVLDVMAKCNIQKFDAISYHTELKRLVDAEEIVELEYVSPDMPGRIKSLFFQKGTVIVAQ